MQNSIQVLGSLSKAALYIKNKNLELASLNLTTALLFDSNCAVTYFVRGYVNVNSDNLDLAIEDYKKCLFLLNHKYVDYSSFGLNFVLTVDCVKYNLKLVKTLIDTNASLKFIKSQKFYTVDSSIIFNADYGQDHLEEMTGFYNLEPESRINNRKQSLISHGSEYPTINQRNSSVGSFSSSGTLPKSNNTTGFVSPRKLSSSTVSSSGTIQSIENVLLVCKFEVAGRIEFKQVYSTIDISFNGLKRLLKVPVNSVLFYKDHYELISICEDEDLMFMFDKVVDGEVYIVVRSR